jgi:transposase
VHDSKIATDVLDHVDIVESIVLGDKAYGAKKIREYILERGGDYCIPPKANNPDPWYCDWWIYKERHLVECFFNKLKHFRRVATRYDKLAKSYFAFVLVAAIAILVK